MKICVKCFFVKELCDFTNQQLRHEKSCCNLCIKKDKSIKNKEYRVKNRVRLSNKRKIYYIENKEYLLEQKHQYYLENKKDLNSKKNEYDKLKRKTKPSFKLKSNITRSINSFLSKKGISKNKCKTLEFVPWILEQLKLHIESLFEPWMNWNNQGNYRIKDWDDNNQSTWVWNLDHIIPHSKFTYTTMDCEDFRQCWALENLRPYSAKQNLIDSNYR